MVKTSNLAPSLLCKSDYKREKIKQENKRQAKVKAATLVGSSAGIAITLATMLHKLKKGDAKLKISDLKFGEIDVVKMGAASIIGGLTGGLLTDKKKNHKAKLKEANIQFFGNLLAPVTTLALATKIVKPEIINMPQLKSAGKVAKTANQFLKETPRIALTIASLTAGLNIGNKIINNVNKKLFHDKKEREVKTSDFSAHLDDLCFTSTFIFKNPQISSLISKVLPATYLIAGMETGTKKED